MRDISYENIANNKFQHPYLPVILTNNLASDIYNSEEYEGCIDIGYGRNKLSIIFTVPEVRDTIM